MKKLILYTVLGASLLTIKAQEESAPKNKVFDISSSLVIDQVNNLHGGLEKGSALLALFDFNLEYRPFRHGWLQNTTFTGHLLKTGGANPSENLIGDVQIASNIEGRASRFIYELYVSQQLGSLNITAGLHDLNSVFMASDYASDFINSSFGIFPAVSLNVPVSIFPVTSFGVIATYGKPRYDLVIGLYNLNHDYIIEETFDFGNHFYQKGFLGVGEFRYRWRNGESLYGEYKVGAYLKDCYPDEHQSNESFCDSIRNHGVYLIADQGIARIGANSQLGLFLQIGRAPADRNEAPEYYGGGFSLRGNSRKGLDRFYGLAIGHAGLLIPEEADGEPVPSFETVIELSARLGLTPHISLQPDIQYILQPAGIHQDALVCMVRLIAEL